MIEVMPSSQRLFRSPSLPVFIIITELLERRRWEADEAVIKPISCSQPNNERTERMKEDIMRSRGQEMIASRYPSTSLSTKNPVSYSTVSSHNFIVASLGSLPDSMTRPVRYACLSG
jgi:hypothetical protein